MTIVREIINYEIVRKRLIPVHENRITILTEVVKGHKAFSLSDLDPSSINPKVIFWSGGGDDGLSKHSDPLRCKEKV